MVVFAVELMQFGLEVRADFPHDLLAPVQHRLREHSTTVFGHKHQVDMEVADHMTTGSDLCVRLPAR
ncbi:hypothetical protein GCM10023080_036890 [Streptomyces pseudoechinosporeus]